MWTFHEFLRAITKHDKFELLNQSEQGLEKESLRVTVDGLLSKSQHPKVFGASLTNPVIKTDYSESQIEFATPYFFKTKDLIRNLENLHTFVHQYLKNEYLWCSSMPCILPKNQFDIPIADYGESNQAKLAMMYRMGLTYRYGRKMQTISGIHYNYSYSASLITVLWKFFARTKSRKLFKDECYFHVIRNYLRISWLVDYLFGSSSVFDTSYNRQNILQSIQMSQNTVSYPYATSLRMSSIGYTSKVQEKLCISYNDIKSYCKDLKHFAKTVYNPYTNSKKYPIQLNPFYLQREAELYAPIRPKQPPKAHERMTNGLLKRGVRYLEFRNIDLDPYSPIGITEETLDFLHLLGIYCLAKESPLITEKEYRSIKHNRHLTAFYGRKPNIKLKTKTGLISLKNWAFQILKEVKIITQIMDNSSMEKKYQKSVEKQLEKIKYPDKTPSNLIQSDIQSKKESFVEFISNLSKKYHTEFLNKRLDSKTKVRINEIVKRSIQQEKKLVKESKKIPFSTYIQEYNQLLD